MALGNIMQTPFGHYFDERRFVSRVYADSLRDNFIGFTPAPESQEKFNYLKAEYDRAVADPQLDLSHLLRIEAGLIDVLPDDLILAKFWTVYDRFNRVVPLATRNRYETSAPPRGNAEWAEAAFVRNQARTLLDVIHSNYVINIGREVSIRRLKIMLLIGLLITLSFAILFIGLRGTDSWSGYVLLISAGITGSVLSISNRLQNAVSRDAMTEDGVYELVGLRLGWVGLLVSMTMGGISALVLYSVVMADLLNQSLPTAQTAVIAVEPGGKPPTNTIAPPTQLASLSAKQCMKPINGQDGVQKLATALCMKDVPNFFKMLILAFLAGFAERLVPDILERLSKQHGRK